MVSRVLLSTDWYAYADGVLTCLAEVKGAGLRLRSTSGSGWEWNKRWASAIAHWPGREPHSCLAPTGSALALFLPHTDLTLFPSSTT